MALSPEIANIIKELPEGRDRDTALELCTRNMDFAGVYVYTAEYLTCGVVKLDTIHRIELFPERSFSVFTGHNTLSFYPRLCKGDIPSVEDCHRDPKLTGRRTDMLMAELQWMILTKKLRAFMVNTPCVL